MSGPLVYLAREPVKTAPNAPMIAVGIPTRATSPPEFYISLLQMMHPLNTRMTYIIQKGMLPAAARNAILDTAIKRGIAYVLFLDDDIVFPDITMYRMWVNAQRRPEAGVITAVYGTKLDPTEPFLYTDSGSGAFWDWPLGALVPIHSAGAGCMIVNVEYVKKLTLPFFDDVHTQSDTATATHRSTWGHDRYFMNKVRDEAGGVIYADTGLLLCHWDVQLQRGYILPPDAPCFQRPPLGESFVPIVDDGMISFRRMLPPVPDSGPFKGYLEWLGEGTLRPPRSIALVGTPDE
jgi:hypothetical protein